MNIRLKDLLVESPDHIPGKNLTYDSNDAITFIATHKCVFFIISAEAVNKRYRGGATHEDLKEALDEVSGGKNLEDTMDRLHKHYIHIYPNTKDFKKIKSSLVDIVDNEYYEEGRIYTKGKVLSWWADTEMSVRLTKSYLPFIKYIAKGNLDGYVLELYSKLKLEFMPILDIVSSTSIKKQSSDEAEKQKQHIELLKKYHRTPPGEEKNRLKQLLFGDDTIKKSGGYNVFNPGYSVAENIKLKNLLKLK